MENYIKITTLNDFIFCPKSIYFHELYEKYNTSNYHKTYQKEWRINHESIDNQHYSNKKDILQWITVYSEKYKLLWKIDIYDKQTKTLIERKTKIKEVYLWYKYQLYAQFFCMQEMWYEIIKLKIYSMKDNKNYFIPIPDEEEKQKFEKFLTDYMNFDISKSFQQNPKKCQMCIYKELCDINLSGK